ncbi:MAG: GNAT family N-acetyltransferase [Ardenticatenaceae bacterium]
MNIVIQEMRSEDYDEVLALWQSSPGVGLSHADSREGIRRFLERNPALSFVARDNQELVGVVLGGHDGRRGYIHHLTVRQSHRRAGIGGALVERCLSALRQEGIGKCHLFVFKDNQAGIAFWKESDWTERIDLIMMSRYTE